MFSSVRHTSVARQVIEQVRNAILVGELRPGDKLDSEAELVEKFQVSKQILRESIRALEYLGLVEIRKGAKGGVYIAEVDMKTTLAHLTNFLHFKDVSISHISEVRELIEPYCARLAAERITDEDLILLKNSIEECEKESSAVYSPNITRSEIKFHRIISAASGNPIIILLVDFIEDMLQDLKDIIRPDEKFTRLVIRSHKQIYHALEERNPEKAYQEMLNDVSKVGESLFKMASTRNLERPL